MNPERLKRLMDFGLTEYEARAYSALLELEVATAGKLAELARVPRTKIYGALDGLAAKRLVKLVPERPMRYVALPFQEYLEVQERDLAERTQRLASAKDQLLAEFTPKGNIRMEEDGAFVVFRGRSNVTSKLFDMITRSQAAFVLLATENSSRRVDYHMAMVRDRAAAGVEFRMLCPVGERNADVLAEFARHGRVRAAAEETPGVAIAIRDDDEALIMHFLPDDDHHFQGSDVALWTDDKAMVLTLKAMLEAQWLAGRPAEASEPAAQPGSRPAARQAAEAAALHEDVAPGLVEA